MSVIWGCEVIDDQQGRSVNVCQRSQRCISSISELTFFCLFQFLSFSCSHDHGLSSCLFKHAPGLLRMLKHRLYTSTLFTFVIGNFPAMLWSTILCFWYWKCQRFAPIPNSCPVNELFPYLSIFLSSFLQITASQTVTGNLILLPIWFNFLLQSRCIHCASCCWYFNAGCPFNIVPHSYSKPAVNGLVAYVPSGSSVESNCNASDIWSTPGAAEPLIMSVAQHAHLSTLLSTILIPFSLLLHLTVHHKLEL